MQFSDNEDLQSEWREAKRINKIKVADFIKEKTGYIVNPDAMFDVQVIFPAYPCLDLFLFYLDHTTLLEVISVFIPGTKKPRVKN